MKVQVHHRFGGHNNRPTEWEITSEEAWLFEVGPKLPVVPGCWTSFQAPVIQPYDGYSAWLILDAGTPADVAWRIARAIVEWDFDALCAAIREVK